MDKSLLSYVAGLKKKGIHQDEIIAILTESGWRRVDALSAVRNETLPLPPLPDYSDAPVLPGPALSQAKRSEPVAVVQNFSVRGFEYVILFIALWASALSIGGLAHSYIGDIFSRADGNYTYGEVNEFNGLAVTMLIITFPIFAYMFLRLKKAELTEPDLRQDPSRRRLIQLTQLVSFLTGIAYIAYFTYTLIVPDRYSDVSQTSQNFWHMLVTLVIAGGIFAYYWRDDHKKDQ